MQSLAEACLGGVRVRASVDETVAVRRTAAEEAPSVAACAAMAVRTLILMRLRSPFDMPPYSDMTSSWASLPGSTAPPTSGTHSSTPKCVKTG